MSDDNNERREEAMKKAIGVKKDDKMDIQKRFGDFDLKKSSMEV